MDWQKWNKNEPARLACYVHVADTIRVFDEPHVDAELRRDRLATVRRVYEFLAAKGIPYDTSLVDFADYHQDEQVIRQPWEMLRGGNCLELTLLFAALCQRARLRTLVVLLERHAMIAVRLDHDVESLGGDPGPDDWELLSGGLLPPGHDVHDMAAKLAEWVAKGRCVLIECTGMAAGRHRLTFDDSVTRGLSQLTGVVKGALTQVVDVGLFLMHERSRYRPYEVTAHEVSSADAAEVVLGEAAITVVRAYLARLDAPPPEPERWNVSGLGTMLAAAGQVSELGVVLRGLCEVLKAGAFVKSWMPHHLTSQRLGAAMITTFPGKPGPVNAITVTDYLAHVFLHRTPGNDSWKTAMVDYIATVALNAGLDVLHPRFYAWAVGLLDEVRANDTLQAADKRRNATQWRLRISLHGSLTGQWPTSVMAWLFDGDKQIDERTEPCEPTQSSAEAAVGELLAWAIYEATDENDELKQVEIAVPTSLLTHWRPEETTLVSKIGLRHDVVVRWSGRLGSRRHMLRMLSEAPQRWEFIDQRGADALVWLKSHQTGDVDTVRELLASGKHQGAMGLRFLPDQCDDLLATLLSFSPVLLWPGKDQCAWDDIDQELRLHWKSLPSALANAYRASWTQDEPPALAVVRAVWDDQDWMAFCRSYLRTQPSLGRSGG
ncbi:hypothetical protein SAMN04488564_12244 [Lentzea waywayandensis]|uniref:vWA-MoxR associated protein middle region 2 domain-containing protein n=1 Tax=Lentzea waywayandensis TaxID=84724 RepID=A0A1I6FIT8_9PSEU|nr:hypothetical protein [Lentzea waywayandensis]SFR29855.1 hypothetical protein SAMN04488564_12244 [Lentzea waywayandensis]